MKNLLFAGVLVCIGNFVVFSGSVYSGTLKLEPGFVRLDDGKSLKGWVSSRGKDVKIAGWSVVDGAIHLDAKKARGHLVSTKTHSKNCIIHMQFRAAPRADSGVYIYGKQLQVRDYPTAGPKQYASAAKPAGKWNDLEFDIKDGVAVVKLNGQVIEKAWRIGNKSGMGILLQRERGNFDFRFIRIKER